MLVVELDHLVIRLTEVCPPGIYFDICREQILAILINGALDDFIAYAEADGLLLSTGGRIGNVLPAASNVYSLSLTRVTDIPAAALHLFKPPLFGLASAHVPFDDEPGAILDKDAEIFRSIISGIHAD